MSKMKFLTFGTLLAASAILMVDVSMAHAKELQKGGGALLEQRAPSTIIGERTGVNVLGGRTAVGTVDNSLAWSKGNSTIWGKDKAKWPKQ
jgi:hypothetical protein